MKKTLPALFFLLILSCLIWFFKQNISVTGTSPSQPQIIIDAGHGGSDPGKVGINQALEKDINLSISRFLTQYLTAAGFTVVMTRTEDATLANPDDSNQKLSDFKNRAALINTSAPAAVISIHQNSYPDESVKGSQVFCPADEYSRLLAESIQLQCRRLLDPDNRRNVKENGDYYLFRNTDCPIVIVECGFLSNHQEAALLGTESYQQKTAWAIYMGIMNYFKKL